MSVDQCPITDWSAARRALGDPVEDWTALRKALGHTQEELATILRVNIRTVQRLERGFYYTKDGKQMVSYSKKALDWLRAWLREPHIILRLGLAGVPVPEFPDD